MSKLSVLLTAALLTLAAVGWADSSQSLPEAIDAAKQAIAASASPSACQTLAQNITRLTEAYATSSLVPEALFLCSQLEAQAGHKEPAIHTATRVVLEHSVSEFAEPAFMLAWDGMSTSCREEAQRAEFARTYARKLATHARASKYYRLAFDAYGEGQDWQNAASVGKEFFSLTSLHPGDPMLIMDYAETCLRIGEQAMARAALTQFIISFPALPPVVTARVRVGQICAAAGESALARENYSLAWSTFQQHHRESAYAQTTVARDAALALWELQKNARQEFERLTAIDAPFSEKVARLAARDLIEANNQVMRTHASFAPLVLNANGDVHRRLGDALLAECFRTEQKATDPPSEHCPQAMKEYAEAAQVYAQSYEQACHAEHETDPAFASSDAARLYALRRQAAVNAFETIASQGDVVFARAFRYLDAAPMLVPGSNPGENRFAYLKDKVAPLLSEGLRYKMEALDMAAHLPVARPAEQLRETLDAPLRRPLADLAAMCTDQNQALATASTQLAQSFTRGFQASSATALIENVENSLRQSERRFTETQKTLSRFYEALRKAKPPAGVSDYWDNALASLHHDQAVICRTVQDDLGVALASITGTKDNQTNALRGRLAQLQVKGGEAEVASLVGWRQLAQRYSVQHPLAEQMAARLGQLNPREFGITPDDPSASRKR